MLYITTRGNRDAYTAHRTLCSDFAPDGGCFIPMSMPKYTESEILALKNKTFSETVAEVLNQFFSTQMSGLDVDLLIGRSTLKMVSMNLKLVIAEIWRSPSGTFSHAIERLYRSLAQNETVMEKPTEWVRIAVRTAVLFAIYGQMLSCNMISGTGTLDISIPIGDFTPVSAAIYAKDMGLPIGMIICTADENNSPWELIQRSSFTPSSVDASLLPGLERLIHLKMGTEESLRFQEKCRAKRNYLLDEERFSAFSADLFCAVAGNSRAGSTINSIFRSNSYLIDPVTAYCYGGLQDYRAKAGESRLTLLISEETPLHFAKEITEATGVSKNKLADYINRPE